jgi:hypothetical protein
MYKFFSVSFHLNLSEISDGEVDPVQKSLYLGCDRLGACYGHLMQKLATPEAGSGFGEASTSLGIGLGID